MIGGVYSCFSLFWVNEYFGLLLPYWFHMVLVLVLLAMLALVGLRKVTCWVVVVVFFKRNGLFCPLIFCNLFVHPLGVCCCSCKITSFDGFQEIKVVIVGFYWFHMVLVLLLFLLNSPYKPLICM